MTKLQPHKVLICWVGVTDLKAAQGVEDIGLGPIAQAVIEREYDHVLLIHDFSLDRVEPYRLWLQSQSEAKIALHHEPLTSPTHFGEIYEAAIRGVETVWRDNEGQVSLTFHLSPGTPAMAAVWIILGKTRYPAELIESSKVAGVRTASVPFDLSADFLPDLLREQDERLKRTSGATSPDAPEFADITYRGRVMRRLIDRARKVAARNLPVLIEGETGTGKEMLARAIHRASPRRNAPFVAVNCGAIPETLIESELLGHEKDAFTGATRLKKGYFEAAHTGTLFLDEVGELPTQMQVKLLRVLQEREVVRLGSTTPVKVDFRVIAATHRTLTDDIATGLFREDLFYRLAIAVLKIPPLRKRTEDLGPIIDRLLEQVNLEAEIEPGYQHKKLSAGARKVLFRHPWPGNVRELLNTLHRVAVWSEGQTITADDAKEALLAVKTGRDDILDRPLSEGFSLPDLIKEVARHYLERAMDEAGDNKTKAADLVGLGSYQTLTNWLTKYGVQD